MHQYEPYERNNQILRIETNVVISERQFKMKDATRTSTCQLWSRTKTNNIEQYDDDLSRSYSLRDLMIHTSNNSHKHIDNISLLYDPSRRNNPDAWNDNFQTISNLISNQTNFVEAIK